MPKEMVSIPEGNLLSVAATKSITTLSALKEKTGVDRKTLRSINAGQPVKQTTLQSIADKLRIPISHLLNADKNEVAGSDINEEQFREIKLQQLDGPALRNLASETDEITWSLHIDQMLVEIEAILSKLEASLRHWYMHLCLGPEETNNLAQQISYIKTSTDIEKSVEELARHKLKIFGGTYVWWDKAQVFCSGDRKPLPLLKYKSELRAALKITPEDKTGPTIRVGIGWVPPREFVESKLVGIDVVEVDGTTVWSRGAISKELEQFLGFTF
jgi:Cro/C1-type HTH DNA-binding domain